MNVDVKGLIKNHHELDELMAHPPPHTCESSRAFQRAAPTLKRGCAACGLKRTTGYGPDPCLGYLPGVRNACCGHGVEYGYIQFENGLVIRGVFHTDRGPGPGNIKSTYEVPAHQRCKLEDM